MSSTQKVTSTETIVIPTAIDMTALLGERDMTLRFLEERFKSKIVVRGNEIFIEGETQEVALITNLISDFVELLASGETLDADIVEVSIEALVHNGFKPIQLSDDTILAHRGKAVKPKTSGQKRYVDAIRSHTITFGIGPAGTGKTYLAMACAVAALKRKQVARIILTRPAVEAGESLGFLPGTLSEKVDPYLRPLYDALLDMMDIEKSAALIERGVIEVAPLAYMRGRTLNDSFVILDEAQNTTPQQMKMFLTRLGFNSKVVVTGDVTQLDLPKGISGLRDVRNILTNIDDISFQELESRDVVRHKLVQRIVNAYEAHESGFEQMSILQTGDDS